jgi:hypothetical protein
MGTLSAATLVEPRRANASLFLVAYTGIAVGAVVGWLLYRWAGPTPLASGSQVGLFALLYVFAQAIERLLEPVSSFIDARTGAKAAQETANKVVVMFALASAIAMILSGWLGVFLLAMIGVHDVPVVVDIAVTGLAIGGGTKPLHDLITLLQRK